MGYASAAGLPEQLTIAGRYRVEHLLGRGGIGAVYAVVDGASGKRVARKRLSLDANSVAAALFEREYHTLAGLKHPCIVEVYDYGSDALGAFYTMELVEGVEALLGHADGLPVVARAQRALQVVLELSPAEEGFLVLADAQGDAVVHSGSGPPSPELLHWIEQAMLDSVGDEQTLLTDKLESDYKVVNQTRYGLSLLWAHQNREPQVVAALVLGRSDGEPSLPGPDVVGAIALYLMAEV